MDESAAVGHSSHSLDPLAAPVDVKPPIMLEATNRRATSSARSARVTVFQKASDRMKLAASLRFAVDKQERQFTHVA